MLATAGSTTDTFVGYGYRVLPEELAFDPPAILQITIAASDWESGEESNLSVKKYNATTGWRKVPAQVHAPNRTVKATITQSGMYTLFENTTIAAVRHLVLYSSAGATDTMGGALWS